jgi:hypothetical protein
MTQGQVNRIAHRFEPRMRQLVAMVLRAEDIVLVPPPVRPPIKDRMDAFLRGKLQSFEVSHA